MTPALVELRNVSKQFTVGDRSLTVLHDLSLQIDPGEFVAIVGASGNGKSTLLNMITGIDRPSTGEVWVNNTPLHKLDENQLSIWRGKQIGIVFQFFQLLPALTLLQNVILPMDFAASLPRDKRKERAEALLRKVGLGDQMYKLPGTVSGGQQQRAAIARALANNPPLIVADEPTGNLDTHSAEDILTLFERLHARNRTIVMVTHSMEIAARANRIIRIVDGRIASDEITAAQPALRRA